MLTERAAAAASVDSLLSRVQAWPYGMFGPVRSCRLLILHMQTASQCPPHSCPGLNQTLPMVVIPSEFGGYLKMGNFLTPRNACERRKAAKTGEAQVIGTGCPPLLVACRGDGQSGFDVVIPGFASRARHCSNVHRLLDTRRQAEVGDYRTLQFSYLPTNKHSR
jgi:hypothetical protein